MKFTKQRRQSRIPGLPSAFSVTTSLKGTLLSDKRVWADPRARPYVRT